jgi:multidrug efflux system membrane fusion protein
MEAGKTEQELAPQAETEPVVPTNRPASLTRRRQWTWGVVIVVVILSAIAAIRHFTERGVVVQAASPAGMGPVPVTTATAKLGSIGIYLDAIGTVTPVYTATITPQVTGVITAVHYREGQFVRKGDALIDIDSRSYAAQLEQAQGTLERDQNLLSQAQMDLQRYQEAWSRNGISRQTFEDQQKVVLQQKGNVRYDEGVVHYDEVQVGYCHITAPIAGRVGLRLVDPGNLATANGTTALAVITQIQPITVVFTLAEDHLNEVLDQIRRGAKLPVEVWDRKMHTKLTTGQLATVDNQIDTTTGTVKLRATFDNRDNALFPNQFVNTRLPVKTLQNQVVIPSSAVQHNGDAAFVYVIQNGQAKMTSVKPGSAEGGMIAVEGILPGEIVANSNFERLQNGSKIATSTAQLPSTASEGNMP